MTANRLLRIAVIAGAFAVLFVGSQAATAARAGETVPGARWAMGVLSALFIVRAIVTEWTRGPEDNLQKDILWGLGAGGIVGLISVALRLG